MKNSSKAKPATTHSRFIPREELGSFAAWTPSALGAGPTATASAPEPPAAPTAQDIERDVSAARQAGYQDGYRDGLVALESFKQSFAMQTTTQIGEFLKRFDGELDALEQQMAQAMAQIATQLARQVVRSELVARPELICQVAQDAVNTVLMSARHVAVRVHPDDHALVMQGAAEALEARGARLLADASVQRGGCVIESDLGVINADIESRWTQAAAMLGSELPWTDAQADKDDTP